METPEPIRERRRAARIAEHLPFKIGRRGYAVQAVTQNISTTGAMCWVEEDIPMMTQLDIALSLEGGPKSRAQKIQLKGVVVRKDKDAATGRYSIAIFFSDVQPADRKKLEKFIQRRLSF